MIESNILGAAAGVQYQGVIDKSEGTVLPALSNGVIIGRFKRGYTGKVFTVTADSYKTVLGHDPSNPSYMAVADLFSRGVSEVGVLRVGMSGIPKPSLDDYLLAGGAPIAMDKAVTDLIGEGVEWTADVEGRAVNHTNAVINIYTAKKAWNTNNAGYPPPASNMIAMGSPFLDVAAAKTAKSYGYLTYTVENKGTTAIVTCVTSAVGNEGQFRTLYLFDNTAYDPSVASAISISTPISDIAAQVRANAAAGHAASQQAVADSAK